MLGAWYTYTTRAGPAIKRSVNQRVASRELTRLGTWNFEAMSLTHHCTGRAKFGSSESDTPLTALARKTLYVNKMMTYIYSSTRTRRDMRKLNSANVFTLNSVLKSNLLLDSGASWWRHHWEHSKEKIGIGFIAQFADRCEIWPERDSMLKYNKRNNYIISTKSNEEKNMITAISRSIFAIFHLAC